MSKQSPVERHFMLCDFLRVVPKRAACMQRLDAIQASRLLLAQWGVRADWHELSEAFECLIATGEAVRDGQSFDTHPAYRIL